MRIDPTVFIVDDDPAVRKLLTQLIRSVRLPVETFDGAKEFLAAVPPDSPGCIILDIRIPAMSGLELQQRLIELESSMPIIVLTGYSDVSTAVQTLKAGAFDYVEKPFQNQQLLDTIQAALRKNQEIRSQHGRITEIKARLDLLSQREREVMELVIAGNPSKVVASRLRISGKTVEYHRANIMKKMKAQNLVELIRMMQELNISTSTYSPRGGQ